MRLSFDFADTPVDLIVVRRDERQRQANLDTSDLDESIRQRGIMNPLIIGRDMVLVAGERRLISAKKLGFLSVPTRFVDELSSVEAQIIELEENLKRKDLHWRDEVRAIANLHRLYQIESPDWTGEDTSKVIGVSAATISVILRVSRSFDDPRIANATGTMAAYNILSRVDDRALADALSDIMDTGKSMFDTPANPPGDAGEGPSDPGGTDMPGDPSAPRAPRPAAGTAPPRPRIIPAEESILQESFLSWAPAYEGRPFNFIHCDFPYGVDFNAGPQSGKNSWESYDDKPGVYWDLCKCLCDNLPRLMSHSAHLMFWFSMEHYSATIEFFRKNAPDLHLQTFPLVWLKSDNVGILPDPKRGPRRIYETALIGSVEDRLVVKPVANAYPCPTDKQHHMSTKPEPMLRHFFQMFVDNNTRMLDPTCGGGSALRAAESMGAEKVLGLEVSPEHCASARSALRQFRVLREASK